MAKRKKVTVVGNLTIADGYKVQPVLDAKGADTGVYEGTIKIASDSARHSLKVAIKTYGNERVSSELNADNGKKMIVVKDCKFRVPSTLAAIKKGVDLGYWTEAAILGNIAKNRALAVSTVITKVIKIAHSDADYNDLALNDDKTFDLIQEMELLPANKGKTRKQLMIEIGKALAEAAK